jgi:hypothetical protein
MHIYISIITIIMEVQPDAPVDVGVALELAGTKAQPPRLVLPCLAAFAL